MAPNDDEQRGTAALDDTTLDDTPEAGEGEEKPKLNLDVKIESRSACERHITVTIPREEIDRYLDKTYSEMMDKAVVPGFRAGRAPRKLVQLRYRKDVADQVKGSLLMDSLGRLPRGTTCRPSANPTSIRLPSPCPKAAR
jgi:trigger factor